MTGRVPRRLALGTLALFAARLILSLIRSGPVLVADEIGYLTNARVLAGGLAGQLQLAPFYRGGYSLLIAPLASIGSPTLSYHLILALNAALAASVLPLLYLLLTRFASVRPELALWAALAGAAYPALTVLSQVAMSENALFPLVCAWLIAFAGLLEASRRGGPRRELAWAAGLGAATGALWAVHNRMIVAVAIAVAGLIWLGARRRLRPASVGLGLGVIAAALVGVHFLDHLVADRNYGGSAPDELTARMHDLLSPQGVATAAANLAGQAWYLLAATFGLAGAAAAGFLRGRRSGAAGADRPAPVLGVLLALTALLLLISAAAFPEWTRPDMLIYGRYTEIAAPALVAFGVISLSRAWSSFRPDPGPNLDRRSRAVGRWWPAGGFLALTGVVVLIRATASSLEAANRWNVSALPFLTVQLGPAILVGAALVALAGGFLLARASAYGRRPLAWMAIGLFLPVIAYGAWNPVRSSQRAVYPPGWESPQPAAERAGAKTVAYDLDHYDTIGLYTVQWFLPRTRVTLFHGDRQSPPSRFVLSGESWSRRHPGARPLWSAVGRDETLWEQPPRGAR